MGTRLTSLIRKEFTQTFRDLPIVMLVIYVFAEILLCGWALTMDVKHVPTAVLDRDHSTASRALVERFRQAESFSLDYYPADERQLQGLLDSGQAALGVVIPPGLGRDLSGVRQTSIQVLVDGTQSNAALLSLGYVEQIVRRFSSEIEVTRLSASSAAYQSTFSGLPAVVNNMRAWYLPEMRYIHFNAVSMVSLAVVMVGVLLAAAGIVREKETGTLEQLMVTPIRPVELILAKVAPMVLLEIAGLLIGMLLSYLVFGVAPHGNPAATLTLFVTLSTLAFIASAGIGVWIATYARNLMQALLLAFFVLFPVMFLSGTITPVSAMPQWLQWLAYASPMTHYLSLALGIFLKGAGMVVVWPHVLALAAFAAAILAIALARFRRSLV